MSRVVGGRYKLLHEVGRGGMGSIWLALDPVLERRVAIKLLHPVRERDAEWLARFHREAQAVARLQHANVVSVYDFGIDDDMPYTVMELLEGEDLEALIARQGSLSMAVTLSIVNGVAQALSAAHAAGIVHCDLKPANIFLSRTRTGDLIKVLDFGVAWMVSPDDPSSGSTASIKIAGTPAYMSPEQVTRKNIDHRADLWSLAVVAYLCLTGKLPFPQQTLPELFLNIVSGQPITPSVHAPELTTAFDDFMTQGLAKSADARFGSANEFLAAFKAATELANADRPAQLLVVDDEMDIEQLLLSRFRREIRKRTYEMHFAHNGPSALDTLQAHPDIDVALLDINMPGMDGLTLLRRVVEVAPLVRVIMVSAYGDMTNVRTAMRSGAFDFVVKPIDTADLKETMDKAIRHVREFKRALRSTEENRWLRTLIGHGAVDRLLPSGEMNSPSSPLELVKATVMCIHVHAVEGLLRQGQIHNAADLMRRCMDILAPCIPAAGGVLERSGSNTMLISFQGEEHAIRAIHACLEMHQDLLFKNDDQGYDVQPHQGVGIGISTGALARISISSRATGTPEPRIIGETVSTAMFLASNAFHGDVLLCERMHNACSSAVITTQRVLRTDADNDAQVTAYVVMGQKRVELHTPVTTTADSQYASSRITDTI